MSFNVKVIIKHIDVKQLLRFEAAKKRLPTDTRRIRLSIRCHIAVSIRKPARYCVKGSATWRNTSEADSRRQAPENALVYRSSGPLVEVTVMVVVCWCLDRMKLLPEEFIAAYIADPRVLDNTVSESLGGEMH